MHYIDAGEILIQNRVQQEIIERIGSDSLRAFLLFHPSRWIPPSHFSRAIEDVTANPSKI
jgi:hypothetical protein